MQSRSVQGNGQIKATIRFKVWRLASENPKQKACCSSLWFRAYGGLRTRFWGLTFWALWLGGF